MSSPPANITSPPSADQRVLHNEKLYTTIKEGLAYILVPASDPKTPQAAPRGDNQPQSVFYNPIQQFNRDLSVLAIKAYGEQAIEEKKKIGKNKHEKRQQRQKRKRDKGSDISEGGALRKAGKLDKNGSPLAALTGKDADADIPSIDFAEAIIVDKHKDLEEGQEVKVTAKEEQKDKEDDFEPRTTTSPAEAVTNNTDVSISQVPSNLSTVGENTPGNRPKPPPVPQFKILDALSATGLRAIRYSQEIPFTTSVTANDLLAEATRSIELNVKHNKLEGKIKAVTGNALTHMYSFVGEPKDATGAPITKYDVIDLDPYGTAAPFLDAAVQAVQDGGLLCVTCTDAGVWASNGYPEKCFSLYGGTPIKGMHSHEGGLRLILNSIASSAARYGLAMEPLLSLSIDFYARVFVRIHKSAADVKFLAGKTMIVYNCDQGCTAWTTQMIGRNKLVEGKKSGKKNSPEWQWKHVFNSGPAVDKNCKHCGRTMHIAGPMYAGPLHSPDFIRKILADLPNVSKDTYKTTDRIEGMLSTALEEIFPVEENPNSPTASSKTGKYDPSAVDPVPFFFIPSSLSKIIHCVTPHENAFRGALRGLGYRVSRSHTKGGCIKTDAPWDAVWEVMREWTRQKQPIREGAIKENTAGWTIMGLDKAKKVEEKAEERSEGLEEEKLKVVFDEELGKEQDAKKLVRYQLNPRENWGPMNRARGKA